MPAIEVKSRVDRALGPTSDGAEEIHAAPGPNNDTRHNDQDL
jgi:hypothetical protein